MLLDKRVDGLIICSARLDDERLLRVIAPHRAVVLINRAAAKRHAATIEVDYCAGVEAVVTQLSALDRMRLGFAAGPAALQGGRKRREGIEAALARHGLSPLLRSALHAGPPGWRRDRRKAAARGCSGRYHDLLQRPGRARPDEAARTGRHQGARGEMALVGWDDIPASDLVSPALTTLRIAKQGLGEMAMRMLLDRIAGRNAQQGIVIEPDPIWRATTPAV
ncbi:substrate-binding domain-containing protein [Bosea eneae]|uniref:Substrate-binding domain-containing protein n=1 Tax=Bosea eneae TaxID=151454 RepID=A0ABW0IZN1_9HYPH